MQSVPASPPLSKGSVICDLCVALSVLITIWCTFDRAGRSWVKMTRFQRSMKEGETKYHYKRSGNHRPNWRQRYLIYTSLSSLQLLFYFAKLQCRHLLTFINYTSTFFHFFHLFSPFVCHDFSFEFLHSTHFLCLKESDEDLPGHVESSVQDPLLLHGSF